MQTSRELTHGCPHRTGARGAVCPEVETLRTPPRCLHTTAGACGLCDALEPLLPQLDNLQQRLTGYLAALHAQEAAAMGGHSPRVLPPRSRRRTWVLARGAIHWTRFTPAQITEAQELRQQGNAHWYIAAVLQVPRSAVGRLLAMQVLEEPSGRAEAAGGVDEHAPIGRQGDGHSTTQHALAGHGVSGGCPPGARRHRRGGLG